MLLLLRGVATLFGKLKIEWCAVNEVGFVSKCMSPNLLLRKVSGTGPFSPGKMYKREAATAYIGVEKVHAMPVNICIEYMDGTDWEKDINKDNFIKSSFHS